MIFSEETRVAEAAPLSEKASAIAVPARERLIVALDVPNATEALALASRLSGVCTWFKVGLELYLASGPGIVEELCKRGHKIFLDLKLHDIPNTVAGAVRSVSGSGASLLTLHASGGPAMLEAAVNAASSVTGAPKLLGVTVLTSMDELQLAATGITASAAEQVLRLGKMAVECGVDGLVCSPRETALLRSSLPSEPLLVVPGIRLPGAAADDQSRTETPASAIQSGASMLVVGRPITKAADPVAAATAILQQITSVLL